MKCKQNDNTAQKQLEVCAQIPGCEEALHKNPIMINADRSALFCMQFQASLTHNITRVRPIINQKQCFPPIILTAFGHKFIDCVVDKNRTSKTKHQYLLIAKLCEHQINYLTNIALLITK